MSEDKKIFKDQLVKTCELSGASWAVCFQHNALSWDFQVGFRVDKALQQEVKTYLHEQITSRWLAGALTSGRTRYRSTSTAAKALRCERLYAFPNSEAHSLILVGAKDLDAKGRGFFQVLSKGIPVGGFGNLPKADLLYRPFELGGEISYNFQDTLDQMLNNVADNLNGQAAYLAVRRGDMFRIEAIWNCAPEARGLQVLISDNPILQEMVFTGESRTITKMRKAGDLAPKNIFLKPARSWLGVPLVLGNRVIALLTLVGYKRNTFSTSDLNRSVSYARRITPFVENAIAFAEAGRHLQRLALLNELASAASAGLEIDQVAKRVLRMLRRTFKTELISLLMLSYDGKTLREYGQETILASSSIVQLENSLAGHVVKSGMPLRVDDVRKAPKNIPINPEVRSELAVPLKYRGRVNGILNMGSREPNAFSMEDEQLLVVIASHLAGLLENVRLSEESRVRARNLGLIHQVIQRVVGLTNVDQIAKQSAALMAEQFGYELATVQLLDDSGANLLVHGVGGAVAHLVEPGMSISLVKGIEGKVIQTGGSYLANNLAPEPEDLMIPDWEVRSQMCVPLRETDLVFGLISVENNQPGAFSENDLLVLESLAGVLSSVMMNAKRYQQLQTSVRHLQAGRETALDIGADLDLDTLLKRVVSRTRELVGVMGAELGLVDHTEQVVRVLVSENPWNDYSGLTFPLMSGVAGQVAALGEPLVVNDYNSWSGKVGPDRRAPFNSVAGVPLMFKGEVIGTLTVYDDQPERVFRDEDVELLELVAPQVAVYIRHAKLYQELQERIEAQQLAENRLVQSARLAAVGEMSAGIAHELNNPLTTVAGFAELILDELPEDFPQRPDLDLILRESVRARGVVRRLLDFSRQSESVREPAAMNEVVIDVLALVHHLARTSGVETVTELEKDLPQIYIDSNQMKQVLLNFVHNALQAMPTGGSLFLETARKSRNGEDWITVTIRDTGEGIPEEYLGRIFEPFFTTKPTGSGTGLGLSISYGIISDHGGFIDVETAVGEGTCFTIWLSAEGAHVDA
jgi:signal transduction histidine kinase